MNTLLEGLNESFTLRIFDGHGNPARVLIGGNDGILVTIGPSGKITVLPPGGPGDPELLTACRSILSGLGKIGGFYLPCIIIEEQMAAIAAEISNAEKGFELPSGVTIKSLNQQLNALGNKLRAEKCSGGPVSGVHQKISG